MRGTLAELMVRAMEAGLNGQRLPNFGNRLPADVLEAINTIYDAARNRGAGDRIRAHRVR